jgi:hypothetical protein
MHRELLSRLARALFAPVAAVMLVPALAGAAITVQDQTDPTVTPQSLAELLGGVGVTISNVTYQGTLTSSGQFQGGAGIIGFEEGVILSSGEANDVPGPNDSDSNTSSFGNPGDPDLDDLSGFDTHDATVLEFDITPQADTLTFDYVFASEEYNEFVESSFNDVFGFFVESGGVKVNCAVVGTPSQPVSINTINQGNPFGVPPFSNPELYRNNDLSDGGGLINTEADGLTVVLTCNASVTPGVPNHIKLAIADASDFILDSWVFLRANSFVSSNISLSPLTATNPLGTPHTVTALVLENTLPAPNKLVTFTVISGPHAGLTGTDLTDAAGEATFTYTGLFAGTDNIQASYVGPQGTVQQSNIVEKIWVDLGAKELELTPETAVNPVGTQHCVTATATNAGGNPAANVTIIFSVTGAVTADGSDVTDAQGLAEFCYGGPVFPGDDLISAFADNNNNGQQDFGEPDDTATKTWVLPDSTPGCKITYGGHIHAANGDRANFGGNATAPDKGNNLYRDHGPVDPQDIKMRTVLAVLCDTNDTHGTIYAQATNGDIARIDVQDLGEPGRDDTYRIQTDSGYDSGEQALVGGGNIQIHH